MIAVTLAGGPAQSIADRLPVCSECGSDFIRHVEDVPAIRQVSGWLEDGRLNVDSLVDDHDYESGRGGHLECGACGWCSSDEDFDCGEIAWDGE